MDHTAETKRVRVGVSARYVTEHPWVVPAITGFFSAYFMEIPGFRVLRRHEKPEAGVVVWSCEAPAVMSVANLIRRLQVDIPPCRWTRSIDDASGEECVLIDGPAEG